MPRAGPEGPGTGSQKPHQPCRKAREDLGPRAHAVRAFTCGLETECRCAGCTPDCFGSGGRTLCAPTRLPRNDILPVTGLGVDLRSTLYSPSLRGSEATEAIWDLVTLGMKDRQSL